VGGGAAVGGRGGAWGLGSAAEGNGARRVPGAIGVVAWSGDAGVWCGGLIGWRGARVCSKRRRGPAVSRSGRGIGRALGADGKGRDGVLAIGIRSYGGNAATRCNWNAGLEVEAHVGLRRASAAKL